jgi:hypothetical protein
MISQFIPYHTGTQQKRINFLSPLLTGMFNWTMSFHSQSDVPTPLGRIVRRTDRAQLTQPQRDFHSAKPLLVAALQSFCGGQSDRVGYLDQLVRHVKVRIDR